MKNPLLYNPDWLTARYLTDRLSLRQIADLARVPNRNPTTVKRALLRCGIQPRTVSDAKAGIPSQRRGIPLSAATRAKLSAAKTGKPNTAVWSAEMREALADKRRGVANPMFGSVSPKRGPDYVPDRKEAQRRANIKSKHGLSPSQRGALLAGQRGRCAVCLLPEAKALNGRIVNLAVDHDHATGKVRGLLCHRCNVSIGLLREDPQLIRRLLRYIEKHPPLLEDLMT